MTVPEPQTSGQMTINLPGVIKVLGESLYSDPSVSVRELIQNANDTCIVRHAEDPNAPLSQINIHFDSWNRKLVVEDNGAGLTKDEVIEFLTVIGSSKTDQVRTRLEEMGHGLMAERLIGRFGIGLLSAFIIGVRIEFTTLSYKEGAEPIWWGCDGGQEYTMGPATKTTPGTIVTVFVDPKHLGMLKDEKLTELIHLYADLLEVPIYLGSRNTPVNIMSAPWHRDATEAEYRQFVSDRYSEDILDIIPIEIEEDEGKFKVGGVLFVPKQPVLIIKEHGDVIVYVRRMFVCKDERTLLPDWAKFVKGIIESPNLRETASRESIQHDENLQRVQRVLGRVLLDYLTRTSNSNPRMFKEIVTNHNLVIKAWAIASDELFERIKDIVLFTTDAGMLNLQRYFEMSRFSRGVSGQDAANRYIFYFTTPGGAQVMLFSAKGLRVIDAQHFPDESFLKKYANKHEDVILKRLDVGGDFIFEELEPRERKWVELEEEYIHLRIDAKAVKFLPEDIPAVVIFPETEPITDQVDSLLADPNLSSPLKSLVRQMWEDREKQRRGRVSGGGVLYLNANNPVIQRLVDLDLHDQEILDVMSVIYNNAMMLSTQGARMHLLPDQAKKVFESNNRTIAALMNKIYEVRDLKALHLVEVKTKTGPLSPVSEIEREQPRAIPIVTQSKHVTCFAALPFRDEYDILLEALRDVVEIAPYFWQVERADSKFFENTVPNNVGKWIARSQCFAVEISENNDNVMMELGHMYWGYSARPLIVLQRDGVQRRVADLGDRLRILYPWDNTPSQSRIANTLRKEIDKFEELKELKGQEHYLSDRLIRATVPWIQSNISEAIADLYETVEKFVGRDTTVCVQELGHIIPASALQDIQNLLRKACGIK